MFLKEKTLKTYSNLIPKIIHYCWFGKKPKSILFKQCLESWQQYCPDFEIIEWNENNSKEFHNKFYSDAIRKKKYAFAADIIRVSVLKKMGGIYVDTDMLFVKPIDDLLKFNFFTSYEFENRPAFGLFGCIPSHRLIQEMENFYTENEFNEFSLPVITHTFKNTISKNNLEIDDTILPVEYFYPLPYEARGDDYSKYITKNTYAVHLWGHSWAEEPLLGYKFYFYGLKKVVIDFLFYGYSKQYFIRYTRGFTRQIYYLLINKK